MMNQKCLNNDMIQMKRADMHVIKQTNEPYFPNNDQMSMAIELNKKND
jgi:hypothetical protein